MLNFKPFAIPKCKRALAALEHIVYERELGVCNLEAPTSVLKEIVAASGMAGSKNLPELRAVKLARHRGPTAHARARYRCFLPDLAGLAGMRRAGPMPDPPHSNKVLCPPIAAASTTSSLLFATVEQ